MQSQYSILKFVSNPLSGEAIAVGLLVIQEGGSYVRYSKRKLDFCAKLYRDGAPLLRSGINGLKGLFGADLQEDKHLMLTKRWMDETLLARFSNYHNGILQFSRPSAIKQHFDEESFMRMYSKVIDEHSFSEEPKPAVPRKGLKRAVHSFFKEELEGRIDLGLTILQEQLPNLYFDFTLDAVGYNGSMYAAKAIDFNSYKRPDSIQTILAEYENLVKRIEDFARNKGISGMGLYWLIIDAYTGTSADIRALHRMVANGLPGITTADSEHLEQFTKPVVESGAKPFSELLEMA